MPQADYLSPYRIAAGKCPGLTFVEFVARNPDVDTATVPETVWPAGGLLTFRSAAAVVEVVSDSAADDADPAGTGAWTVTINGLDSNWDQISETVSLNGTTAVVTTQGFLRINSVEVATTGSGTTNAGNITLRDAGAGTTRSYIAAARGRAETGAISVPRDHTFIGSGWYVTAGLGVGTKSTALVDIMEVHNAHGGVAHVAWTVGVDGSFSSSFDLPHVFEEKTDIHIIARASGANDTIVTFHGHGVLVSPNADL